MEVILSKEQQLYFKIIDDLHSKWKPHTGQLEVGKKLLLDKCTTLFIQCGRKWGKTEFSVYMLWRHALLNPGSACYYVAPTMVHGRRLIWTDPRLAGFGPNDYVESLNSTEMIVRFKNKSFIQVIGSENFQGANGLRPAFLVYDEFSEFHPRFEETMGPNRIVYKCPLVIIGTPPLGDSINKNQYISMAEEARNRSDMIWIQQSSYSNPHIDPLELNKERERYFARGEEYLWYSQYEAKLTAGGKHVIFPMLSKESHVVAHSDMVRHLGSDIRKYDLYCIADPGTTTVMAFLFVAVNPYNKRIYILDEIYERRPEHTSVQEVLPIVLNKAKELAPGTDFDEDWIKVYDEAAAWFYSEVASQYGLHFIPTLKIHNKKENGISLIKDVLVHKAATISDRCVNLYSEMSNYIAKDDGSIPKGGDHLIDALRYFLAAAHYSMVETLEAARSMGPKRLSALSTGVQTKRGAWDDEDWTENAAIYDENYLYDDDY